MGGRLLLTTVRGHATAAIVEGDRLLEIQMESSASRPSTGSIHVARVVRVVPSMSSAFLEAGMERPAYLRLSDVASPPRNGERLLVQVAREARGTKGARVTGFLTLPGTLAVLRPTETGVLVSRRLSDPGRADALRQFVESILPEGMGAILRTAAQGATEEAIRADIDGLCERWKRLLERAEGAAPGTVLSEEDSLHQRALRDHALRVDGIVAAEELREQAESFALDSSAADIEWIPRGALNHRFALERQVDELLHRRVWLKCGGAITIDGTEAMTPVAVDTAKCTAGRDLEATALQVNLEAAREVARQLRLRNIGGLIVIDFVDMHEASGRAALNKALQEVFAGDSARTRILPVSELGLVEMTRRRDRHPIGGLIERACGHCGGSGRQLRMRPEAYRVRDRIAAAIATPGARTVRVGVPAEVLGVLQGELQQELEALREKFSGSLEVRLAEDVALGDHAMEIR